MAKGKKKTKDKAPAVVPLPPKARAARIQSAEKGDRYLAVTIPPPEVQRFEDVVDLLERRMPELLHTIEMLINQTDARHEVAYGIAFDLEYWCKAIAGALTEGTWGRFQYDGVEEARAVLVAATEAYAEGISPTEMMCETEPLQTLTLLLCENIRNGDAEASAAKTVDRLRAAGADLGPVEAQA